MEISTRLLYKQARRGYQVYNLALGLVIFVRLLAAAMASVFAVRAQMAFIVPVFDVLVKVLSLVLFLNVLYRSYEMGVIFRLNRVSELKPFLWVLLLFFPIVNIVVIFRVYDKARQLLKSLETRITGDEYISEVEDELSDYLVADRKPVVFIVAGIILISMLLVVDSFLLKKKAKPPSAGAPIAGLENRNLPARLEEEIRSFMRLYDKETYALVGRITYPGAFDPGNLQNEQWLSNAQAVLKRNAEEIAAHQYRMRQQLSVLQGRMVLMGLTEVEADRLLADMAVAGRKTFLSRFNRLLETLNSQQLGLVNFLIERKGEYIFSEGRPIFGMSNDQAVFNNFVSQVQQLTQEQVDLHKELMDNQTQQP